MRERDEERSRRFLDEIKIYYEETKDSLLDGMDEFTWNDLEMDEVLPEASYGRKRTGFQAMGTAAGIF